MCGGKAEVEMLISMEVSDSSVYSIQFKIYPLPIMHLGRLPSSLHRAGNGQKRKILGPMRGPTPGVGTHCIGEVG